MTWWQRILFDNPVLKALKPQTEQPAAIDTTGPYPNGSVPYGPEDGALRLKRFVCAAANHHPRISTGSWCMGYGYVCGRCYMYADPIPKRQLEAMCDALNQLPPDQQQMAAASMSGGGPSPAPYRRTGSR